MTDAADSSTPMISGVASSETLNVRIVKEAKYFENFTDKELEVSKNTRVAKIIHELCQEIRVEKTMESFVALRDSNGIILDSEKSLSKNLVEDGDTLHLCLMAPKGSGKVSVKSDFVLHLMISLLLLISLAMLLWVYIIRINKEGAEKTLNRNYAFLIDAGSVHTNIDVYSWHVEKINGTGLVRQEFSCESDSERGISSFDHSPREVKDYILKSSCFMNALSYIPDDIKDRTEVFLGGTAGMRVMNATRPETAKLIMGNVSLVLNETFPNPRKESSGQIARILTGSDEGIWGWISTNYLEGIFPLNDTISKPYGALDWGGASSQITFALDDEARLRNDKDKLKSLRQVKLFGQTYDVYTKSHMCYGQSEALKRYMVQLVYNDYKATGNITHIFKSPCHPRPKGHLPSGSYKVRAEEIFETTCTQYKDQTFKALVTSIDPGTIFEFVGSSNKTGCDHEVTQLFDPQLCKKTYSNNHCLDVNELVFPSSKTKFYAFSTYWYLVTYLALPTINLNVQTYISTVQSLCSSDIDFARRMLNAQTDAAEENSCFQGVFMHHLLDAYGVWNGTEDNANIEFVNQVNGSDVSWTLGYVLEKSSSIKSTEVVLKSPAEVGLDIAVVIGIIAIIYLCLFIHACMEWIYMKYLSAFFYRSFYRKVDLWEEALRTSTRSQVMIP